MLNIVENVMDFEDNFYNLLDKDFRVVGCDCNFWLEVSDFNPLEVADFSFLCLHNKYNLGKRSIRDLAGNRYSLQNFSSFMDLKDFLIANDYLFWCIGAEYRSRTSLWLNGDCYDVGDYSGWDTSLFGLVVWKKEDFKKHYNIKKITQKALDNEAQNIQNKIEALEHYINGEEYVLHVIGFEDSEEFTFGGDLDTLSQELETFLNVQEKNKEAENAKYTQL